MSTARKAVTILFCDVSGSTAQGEEFDPESLREVIQRYFTEMRAVIERHGGTVERFIGEPPSAEDAQARIASILPAAQERAVVERLAAILGVGGTVGPIQESFWAIRRSFEGLATERPLVLVFDDIQWAETTFLASSSISPRLHWPPHSPAVSGPAGVAGDAAGLGGS